MEMAGESFYKYMAYEKAAASVENAPPLADLVAVRRAPQAARRREVDRRRDRAARGIGKRGAAGRALPAFSAVADRGARRERHRHEDGGDALHGLRHRVARGSRGRDRGRNAAGVPRLGSKTIENWKRGILAYKGRQRRTPLPQALAVARQVVALPGARSAARAPRVRGQPAAREVTVGDVDVVCTSHARRRRRRAFRGVAARGGRARRRTDQGQHLAPGRPADRSARASGSSLRESAAALHRLARAQHQAARVCGAPEPARERERHS